LEGSKTLYKGHDLRISEVSYPEELAQALKAVSSDSLNRGFKLGDLLILNDNVSEESGPEWAIFTILLEGPKEVEIKRIDRLAIMGMTDEEVSSYIRLIQEKIWPEDILEDSITIRLKTTESE